jgi:mono/diheme cytochrome c family protein
VSRPAPAVAALFALVARHAMPVLLLLTLLCCVSLLAACDRSERDMLRQPRKGADEASPLFTDRKATRAPPPDTVVHAMGDAAQISSGRIGSNAVAARDAAEARRALPDRPGLDMLRRGEQRYAIYCLPCHSIVGDGDGPVVRRGFPAPSSFHTDRLRSASDRHLYDVVTQGYGVMYPFADRIEPADRWSIVAFVRALQLSRHAAVDDLPSDLRADANAGPASGANGAWRLAGPSAPPPSSSAGGAR